MCNINLQLVTREQNVLINYNVYSTVRSRKVQTDTYGPSPSPRRIKSHLIQMKMDRHPSSLDHPVRDRGRSSVYKTQSAGPGLRDEDEAEAGVCDMREWKEIGVIDQNEERWFKSQEEMMKEEADER